MDAILIYPKCIIAQKIYKCDLWTKFRLICNRFLKLDKVSVDTRFDIFILLCVFSSVLTLALSEANVGNESAIDLADEIIKYIFLGEVLIKLIGLGV